MNSSCVKLLYCLVVMVLPVFVFTQAPTDMCVTPNGKLGNCVPVASCESIKAFLRSGSDIYSAETQKILRWHHFCGPQANILNMCCPSEPFVIDTTNQFYHQNTNLLPVDKCGPLPSGDRVAGGKRAALFEYPWMALLSYQTANGLEFRCSGTLISDRYVLTSAHCLTGLGSQRLVGVRVGEYNIESEEDCDLEVCSPAIQDLSYEEFVIHNQFNRNTFANDIGLIRLLRPANISVENVKPVCLPFLDRNTNFTNKWFDVSGWGLTNKTSKSTYLLKATVQYVTRENCTNQYNQFRVAISENQICSIGKNNENACEGDSGGPLQTLGQSSTGVLKFIQYGIVSAGVRQCGQAGFPALYTRVDSYLDWILDNIRR